MNFTKLQLSAEELAMVGDSHWLLTKNSIMQKAYLLFGEAAASLQSALAGESGQGAEFFLPSPKIAKGENYKGLPYVMLDYPRHFGKEDIFAFRTMFWWGNFLSFTWHLKGIYAKRYLPLIAANREILARNDFRLCIGEDEWRHDFDGSNYRHLQDTSAEEFPTLLHNREFIKLAVRIPLEKWNTATAELLKYYLLIFGLTGISSQGDGIDLLPGNPKAGFDL